MKNNKKGLKLRQHIKNFFTKNLLIKIVSFVFAMLLWGYVLTAQNPARTKTLNDVTIIYEGQTDLLARNLVIAEGDDELQKTISVQVDTELTKYSDLSSANITATVNMKGITEAGTYELPVTVVSSAGTVRRTSITPSTVSIKVDDLITKSVPIAAQISGELPSGYWNGEPVLSKEDVSISGPAEHINAVTTAVCDIDLSGRTESFEEAKELVLIKSDGSVVSKSLLSGKVPTVGVSLEILKKATLPVDTHGAIIGADQLPSNYEMSSVTSIPAQITVVGDESVIEQLTSISVLPTNVAGAKESITKSVPLTLPEGVRSIDETAVTIYVTITEIQEQINYSAKTIGIEGLGSGLRATVMPSYTSVVVSGRKTLINGMTSSKFRLYVDLTGLDAGEHTCPIIVEFEDSKYAELAAVLTDKNATVRIEER